MVRFPTPILPALLVLASISLVSCNYELWIHDRFDQASFSSKVDVLWVVDNSSSMAPHQAAVAANFGTFIANLVAGPQEENSSISYNDIEDIVDVWKLYSKNPEGFLDYRMAVVTTDMTSTHPDLSGQACGAAWNDWGGLGHLRHLNGAPDATILSLDDAADPVQFSTDFADLLDVGICGSGTEFGMDAASVAICRAMELPADLDTYCQWRNASPLAEVCGRVALEYLPSGTCPDGTEVLGAGIGTRDESLSNRAFLRSGATLVIVVVSDEGDASPSISFVTEQTCTDRWSEGPVIGTDADGADLRMDLDCFCHLEPYLDFFKAAGRRVAVASITAPRPEPDNLLCFDVQGPACTYDFYLGSAAMTGGMYEPSLAMTDDAAQCNAWDGTGAPCCPTADYSQSLNRLGELISNLSRQWVLSRVPDPESIRVFVDLSPWQKADVDVDESEQCGWRYEIEDNAIVFAGSDDCLPPYNSRIDLYYTPQSAGGRPLPF